MPHGGKLTSGFFDFPLMPAHAGIQCCKYYESGFPLARE